MQKVLLDFCYPLTNLEAESAEKLFLSFIENGFSYDQLSSKPDYMVYASAYTLSVIFPDLMGTMLDRHDEDNFLIYGIMTALDPANEEKIYNDRSHALKQIFDKRVIDQICQLIQRVENDPPVEPERLQRIKQYWGCCDLT